MTKTVVALYEELEDARDVVEELVDAGVDAEQISVVARDPDGEYTRQLGAETVMEGEAGDAGEGALIGGVSGAIMGVVTALAATIPGVGMALVAGPIAASLVGGVTGAVAGGLLGALADLDIEEEDAEMYAEGVRRGYVLVAAQVPDNRVSAVVEIMDKNDPIDLDTEAAHWRAEGWEGFDEESGPYTAEMEEEYEMEAEEFEGEEEVTIPVVEEEVKVGKRRVGRKRVRVHAYVREEPVEEDVELTEEHVTVERRKVDRAAAAQDLDTFEEQTIELEETAEEVVVGKEARVVEEVVVRKQVDRRTEHVDATRRRTEVEVEEEEEDVDLEMEGMDVGAYEEYRAGFREHCRSYYQMDYGSCEPAYRYGYDVATDSRYRDRDWEEIEPQVRRQWEEENEGIWDQVKEAVRHAWEEVTDAFDGDEEEAYTTSQTSRDYTEHEEDFRRHCIIHHADDYESCAPSYRYGYDLANDPRYRDRDWDDVEAEARREWEAESDTAWEEVKEGVRYAWNQVKGVFTEDEEHEEEIDRSYTENEDDFEHHYQTTHPGSTDYEAYAPAYRYGCSLAMDPRYRRGNWVDIEPQARADWESRYQGEEWQEYRDSVRYGWERACATPM